MDQDASSSGGWRFAQCFGDKGEVEDITEGASPEPALSSHSLSALSFPAYPADIISTVEFDSTGNYLATGDKGGRVVLFERNEAVSHPCLFERLCVPVAPEQRVASSFRDRL